ncbi:MAG: trigger factor family protein [Muribaculaceae bacterium]|nr:trigger factor family protein [Muribaculaceae bacterium]
MDVTLEKTGELEGRLVVKIEEADYAARVKKELKEIGQTRQIPGFRKGHVDMAQLQKRFGKQVKAGVLNDVASDAALKYIEDNKIAILGQPIPAEENEMNLDDKDFTFVYEIGMMPELNMVFDQNVELDFYNIAVSDEMVAEQDKNIRMQAGDRVTTDTYGDRALVKGTIMQLAEDGQVKADGIQVTDGIVAPFLFKSKEEAAKFEGTKAGDKVVFDAFATCDGNEAEIASMLHIDRDRVEEARGNFEMTITEYVVNKPAELGQEFYDKVFGADAVHNEEEYFARVRDMIAQSLQPNSRSLFVRMTEDYLMETYGANMQLPEGFLRKFMVRVNPEIKAESVDEELKMAIPGMKWEIIEGQAGRVMGVKVEEDDVKAIARSIAMEQLIQYGMGQMAEQMADYYAENLLKDKDQRRRLVDQAYTSKLMNAIHNAVKLNEKTVSLDEFRALVDTLNNASGAAVAAEE